MTALPTEEFGFRASGESSISLCSCLMGLEEDADGLSAGVREIRGGCPRDALLLSKLVA